MSHKLQVLLILLIGLTSFSSSLVAQESRISFLSDTVKYAWPTDATRYLSSTFGETRSAHLHSGIDIRTWGQEGYKVFAARDGEVYRIGIGPKGYGHVIYLKHDDGSFTVYAHLNRFEPDLQEFADSIRLQNYQYELDFRFHEQSMEYKKGDIIGYSGSTGVGPPHLHFEIRDPDLNPINPLLTNLKDHVDDSLPPVFNQIAIEFLSEENYRFLDFEIFNAHKSEDGFDFGDITINGPVGLSVNVHDKANRAPNSYAVHSLMMIHESDTLFHSVKNGFEFSQAGDMFLDRSFPILAQSRRSFQRLFKVSGNRLPIYNKMINQGVLHLDEGSYPIQIIAEDIYGNRSAANLNLNVENSGKRNDIQYVATYPSPKNNPNFNPFSWIEPTVPYDESLIASSGPELYSQNSSNAVFFTTRRYAEATLSPGKMDVLHTADQKLWLQFPNESLYDTLSVRMEVLYSTNQIDIELSPTKLPLNRSAKFNFILPEEFKSKENLALFSVDPYRNRERFISAEVSEGMIRANLNELTNLRIREDRISPWVGRPEIIRNLAGNFIVRIPVKDEDSGIDYTNSKITVNGEMGIIEYDPENNFLMYYHPDFSPSETNTVKYNVLDGVGNSTNRELEILFRSGS